MRVWAIVVLDVRRAGIGLAVLLAALAGSSEAQPAPVSLIDVPFISQSEALCGGAAAAMILRFWGEREVNAESFASLVDRSAAGIRTGALVSSLRDRGWNVTALAGTAPVLDAELARSRPVLTLIEDRPGTYHYVVVVGATERTVFFHDPARAPFRAMPRTEFEERWTAADRWMSIVVPGAAAPGSESGGIVTGADPRGRRPVTACDARVAEGVALAQRQALEQAERLLTASLPCPGAVRELAGVRVLQRRWPEVTELARAATTEDPGDAYAWRLLATSRFVQNDAFGALDAWNRAGEPRIDLISVQGVTRTRPRVVERLIGLSPGRVVDRRSLRRAQRRLDALPSATSARLEYVPVPSGLAEIRANVAERPLVPRHPWNYAVLGAVAAVRRQITFPIGAMTGGGERVALEWRFWPDRPRAGFEIEAPAPWGGIWGIDAAVERQPFDRLLQPARRRTAALSASQWLGSRLWLRARGGVDRWEDAGSFATAAVSGLVASHDDRVTVSADLTAWGGDGSFASLRTTASFTSSRRRRGVVIGVRGGGAGVTGRAPADEWFGGDTGHVRPVLVRAHPILDDGRLRIDRLGRTIVFATAEAQYWKPAFAGSAIGVAAFADSARVGRQLTSGSRVDVDPGVGLRLAVPTLPGTFRLDVAKGLRDGATAVSLVYDRGL